MIATSGVMMARGALRSEPRINAENNPAFSATDAPSTMTSTRPSGAKPDIVLGISVSNRAIFSSLNRLVAR